MGDERSLELPALGRHMQLGMLYDCRDDTLIPGFTLWDPEVLKNDRDVRTQQGTRFNIVASDSINDKSTALNVEASLKASLLGGLVEVRGSAEYISDRQTTSRQSRLTLQYKTTVRFEQLTMKHLSRHNVQHSHVFERGIGTHVVTGILYGAQAFFVFDRYIKEGESEQQVKCQMSAIIKKIPCFNMDGEGDLKLTESEQEEADKLQCKFYGDIAHQTNPTTFQEAVAAYTHLPSMLGESGEFAVPLTFWLYPLSKLDNEAAKLAREISMSAIGQIQDIFEGLDQCNIKCDILKEGIICTDFPKLREKIDQFRNLVLEFKRSLQRYIARALPKVRGGEAEEKILLDIISESEQSPFNMRQLERWVKCREKEMNIITNFMKGFGSSRIIRSREDLDALLFDYSIEHTVAFSFSSVGLEDEYLNALSRYIRSETAEQYSPREEWFDNVAASKNMKIKAKQFREFSTANKESEKTAFGVMGFDDGTEAIMDGGSIFLYENGVLASKDFQPPGAPGKPDILKKCHDSVVLNWPPPQSGSSRVKTYIVRYREASSTQDPGWSEYKTEDATTSATVPNLRPNTTYEFLIAASCEFGESQSSPLSDTLTTFPSCPPHDVGASITVNWAKPSAMADGLNVLKYIVKSIPVGDTNPDHVLMHESDGSGSLCHIENMEPNTTYRVSVSASFGEAGDSEFSKPVDITALPVIDPRSTNFKELIAKCEKVKEAKPLKGERTVYKLPLTKGEQGGQEKYQTYSFGEACNPGKRHLVLMVVGATGAGKSTLINGILNYIFNVEWDDSFRFKIIVDEGENKAGGQSQSQTQKITSYTINPTEWSHLDSKLTIIDTPGFGDTRGIGRDKAIVDQIRDYFSDSSVHQVDHIDVIGFVAQASQARLTHTQKYLFDSMMSIFGKDIEQNISLLVTFADSQKPPLIDAIEYANIPCSNNFYKFNNSALFANKNHSAHPQASGTVTGRNSRASTSVKSKAKGMKEKGECFDEMFWEMGTQSMQDFFFAMTTIQPISLTLTQEVLAEREKLETAIEGLQTQIRMGSSKLDELREEQRILEQHEADIKANRDFVYKMDVQKSRRIDVPPGKYITNCSRCHFTCHYPCIYADDKDKARCSAMDKLTGTCNVCPGKCIWNVHFNQAYKFEFYTEKETRTYLELKGRYNEATDKKLTIQQVMKKCQEEFIIVQQRVYQLITQSHRSIQRLEEIALRSNPLSTQDYVDLLIESEKMEAKPGWMTRVRGLQNVRKGAEIMSQIKQENFDPFQSYREGLTQKGKKSKGVFETLCSMVTSPFRGGTQSNV